MVLRGHDSGQRALADLARPHDEHHACVLERLDDQRMCVTSEQHWSHPRSVPNLAARFSKLGCARS